MNEKERKIVVVGSVRVMGHTTVRDLSESSEIKETLLLVASKGRQKNTQLLSKILSLHKRA